MIAQRNDCDSCPNQVANVTVNIDAALGTCSCFHRRNLFQTCVPRWDQSIGVAFEPLCDSCCRKNSSLYCIVVYGMVWYVCGDLNLANNLKWMDGFI